MLVPKIEEEFFFKKRDRGRWCPPASILGPNMHIIKKFQSWLVFRRNPRHERSTKITTNYLSVWLDSVLKSLVYLSLNSPVWPLHAAQEQCTHDVTALHH